MIYVRVRCGVDPARVRVSAPVCLAESTEPFAMATPPNTFKRPKDRRKRSPGKRVAVSEEARKAYEETMRQIDERERQHAQFLPDEHKGKR